IDPLPLGRGRVRVGVAAPIDAMDRMDDGIRGLADLTPIPNAWVRDDFAAYRNRLAAALRPAGSVFAAHHVVDLVREKLPANGILTCDIGAHTHQVGTQWQTDEPWTCLTTNGWSSMGFGIPAAYAARLVHPQSAVLAVIGDGGFQMTVGELAMARRLNLAVPVIVLNDGWLGLMKVKQEHGDYPLHGVRLGEPVESPPHYFGVPCRPARNLYELSDALDWAMSLGGPSVVEAFIDVAPYSQTVFD
ncbi:MAG TPA: thiamine pyrophosphate-dependent enzyme, partial [Chloroflexota bacterium]